MARVREAVLNARDDGLDKLKIAERVVAGADRLRAEKHLGDLELLESREKLYDVRDDLNKGQSRLAELELERVTAENARKRARLERRLKIGELETKLRLDREKLERTSRVVSPARGQVAQVQSAIGGLVHEGAPVVLLHAPKAEPRGRRRRPVVRHDRLRARPARGSGSSRTIRSRSSRRRSSGRSTDSSAAASWPSPSCPPPSWPWRRRSSIPSWSRPS